MNDKLDRLEWVVGIGFYALMVIFGALVILAVLVTANTLVNCLANFLSRGGY